MKRPPTRLAVCLSLSLLLQTGCASIFSGTKDNVSFVSNPEGATVTVGDNIIGKTPVTIDLQKKSGQKVRFEKDGYSPLTMDLKTTMSGWFFGNILIGGVVGSTTDLADGAIIEYSPSKYMVTMEPQSAGLPIQKGTELSGPQKIKNFIVVNQAQLKSECRTGEGEYLSSLLTLLEVPTKQRPAATQQIVVLSAQYPVAPEFADQVNKMDIQNLSTEDPKTAGKTPKSNATTRREL